MTPEQASAWNHVRGFRWHRNRAQTWHMAALDIALIREACTAQEEHIAFTMRDAGCSWREVGDALGITRQAAMLRYAGPEQGMQANLRHGLNRHIISTSSNTPT